MGLTFWLQTYLERTYQKNRANCLKKVNILKKNQIITVLNKLYFSRYIELSLVGRLIVYKSAAKSLLKYLKSVLNTGLHLSLGAFSSSPVYAMKYIILHYGWGANMFFLIRPTPCNPAHISLVSANMYLNPSLFKSIQSFLQIIRPLLILT